MRIRLGVPEHLSSDETAGAIDAALEAVTRAATPLVEHGRVPTFEQAVYGGKVRWKPEPPGDEHFDLPQTVLRRGWGDCDDLAPWHAASLRATAQDPQARAMVVPSGPHRWHAIVERGDGSIEDPSKAAGMPSRVSGLASGIAGAFWSPMFGRRLSLAAYPLRHGRWAGRVDVPDRQDHPLVYSHLALCRTPARAVRQAITGVGLLGRCGDDESLLLGGLADLLDGVPAADVDAALEQRGCVGFLPFLAPAAASLAAPLASKALSMFGGGGGGGGKGGGGGGGGPGPSTAMAPHPGNAPGTVLHSPGGPIIVRF